MKIKSAKSRPPLIEKLLFNNRLLILVAIALLTVFLGFEAAHLRIQASFEKMIPTYHPYVQNYLKYREELTGLGNVLWIAVENSEGDIFDAEYVETLKNINDEVFFIPGVSRAGLKSLWTPNTRWTAITEEGFEGGPVIPSTYDGSERSLENLKLNVMRSGEIGKLVANNLQSSIILAPLLDKNPETGEPLDYNELSRNIEDLVRTKYQSDKIRIHITGFAKVVGDLIDGASQVALFFAITVVITMGLLFWYTRCWRCTLMPMICALVAVIWQAGMLYLLGFGLDPYSMLVPFLVFAIGVSHGVQMINGIKHQAMMGADKLEASRLSFRILYMPALCALVTDGVGFAILYVIKIGVLQDLAIGAAIRFPVLIIAVLVMLPLLMSYAGVSRRGIQSLKIDENVKPHPLVTFLSKLGTTKGAIIMILVVAVSAVLGLHYRKNLQIGDLDAGAPELRPNSRYNRDVAFMNKNFSASSDVFVVMVETPPSQISRYDALVAMDRLQWELEHLPGVQFSSSLTDHVKGIISGNNEGNIKWYALNRNQVVVDNAAIRAPKDANNDAASLAPIRIYLTDHKAATLARVVDVVEKFAKKNNQDNLKFMMGAGLAGIEAATNIEIEKAQTKMLLLVFGVVGVMVWMTFRSFRATICIMVPLALTTLLCEVLMTFLGIGVKVGTLPVISVGVGIGVDYGVYIYSKLTSYMEEGLPLPQAYYHTLKTTGKAVAFTGVTLAVGVATWAFSPIKFQADMGILLTFMFLWNMIGAIALLPALAHFLVKTEQKVTENSDLTLKSHI